MTVVVLDTNALLLPFSDGTDIEAELEALIGAAELVVPQSVVRELDGFEQGGGQRAAAARGAARLVERCRIEPTELPGDDGLLDVARRLGGVVLSNDRKLQKEARASGLRVVASLGHGRLRLL